MKKIGKKIVIGVLCVFFLLPFWLYTFNLVKDKSYGVANNNDRLSENRADVSLKGGTDSVFNEIISYNDSWFEGQSNVYNHELANSSLLLSLSTFSSGKLLDNWGDDGNYDRSLNLQKAFNGLGFVNDEYSGYTSSLNNIESKAGFGIAMRKYYTDNIATNVIVIAVRSGGYGCEWTDNFNVGDSGLKYHKGFYESALKINDYVKNYVSKHCSGEKIKFWICGYSRGAAVANILATMVDSPMNVYAYTFATPNTVEYTFFANTDYDNIFNIINPYDPVVILPPFDWGFDKFGTTMMFPKYESIAENPKLFFDVSAYYEKLAGNNADIFSYSAVSDLVNMLTSFIKNRNEYYSVFQNVFQDLATATMSKKKVNGIWKKIGFNEFIKDKFNEKADSAISEYENCRQYQALESIGVVIPKYMEQLDIVMRLYGYDNPEKLLLENLTIDSVVGINSLTDRAAFTNFAVGHYPEVYISWMKYIDENKFVIVNHK